GRPRPPGGRFPSVAGDAQRHARGTPERRLLVSAMRHRGEQLTQLLVGAPIRFRSHERDQAAHGADALVMPLPATTIRGASRGTRARRADSGAAGRSARPRAPQEAWTEAAAGPVALRAAGPATTAGGSGRA